MALVSSPDELVVLSFFLSPDHPLFSEGISLSPPLSHEGCVLAVSLIPITHRPPVFAAVYYSLSVTVATGDIECHLGTDGKFYVLDFSRYMPPQPPDKSRPRGAFL